MGASVLGPLLQSCGCDCTPPIGWAPTVLAPVFYGHDDVTAGSTATRIFFPSLNGSPQSASMVTCLGKYPLVVFLHGQCDDATVQDHTRWFRLPAALARSGFIVAVPDLPWGGDTTPWASPNPAHDAVSEVIDWLYDSWSEREWLGARSSLALAGHSFGALLAGRLATEIDHAAYVSIGGGWAEWPGSPPLPVPSLPSPSMFLYGTNDVFSAQPSVLSQAPNPSHRVIFDSGQHWDHLDADNPTCGVPNGPCNLVDELTADLTVMFLSKILRVAGISDTLEPPAFTQSGEQQFYSGNHLTSFDALPRGGCAVTIEWDNPTTGSVSLPWP